MYLLPNDQLLIESSHDILSISTEEKRELEIYMHRFIGRLVLLLGHIQFILSRLLLPLTAWQCRYYLKQARFYIVGLDIFATRKSDLCSGLIFHKL